MYLEFVRRSRNISSRSEKAPFFVDNNGITTRQITQRSMKTNQYCNIWTLHVNSILTLREILEILYLLIMK